MNKSKNKKATKPSKKNRMVIIFILILAIFFVTVFAGYVLNKSRDFYSRTKEFYFNSDKLSEDNPVYQIENWSGIGEYIITINMNSTENNILSTSYDISYSISYTCSDNVICQLSKTSGIISSNTNKDYFTLRIVPNTLLKTGDKVSVSIKAQAKNPYQKELNAKFNLNIGQEKISYEIIDSVYSPYLELNVTNTISYYTVNQAFDTYRVEDKITREDYMNLSEENKQKCYSAIITLKFDPNLILLDMTDNTYLYSTDITNITKNLYNYINGMTFKLDAITSKKVRFYKIDETIDYTYPKGNNNPVINITTI